MAIVVAALQGCGPSDGENRAATVDQSGVSLSGHIPLAWTRPDLFIDPANASGAASDNNACTSATAACSTYAGLAAQWGTYSPRLRQNTTITFLSSHTDNSDPVYLTPYLENGAFLSIQGVLGAAQQVGSGTIQVSQQKNRPLGQLLEVTLPSGTAVGNLVVNATKSSRAWVYKNVAGNTWSISQPIQAIPVPMTTFLPLEDDTWASGDAVTVYTPVAVNLAKAAPNVTDFLPNSSQFPLIFYQLSIYDPAGAGKDDILVSSNSASYFIESAVQRNLLMGEGLAENLPFLINVDFSGDIDASLAWGAGLTILGGQVREPARYALLKAGYFDENVILGVPAQLAASGFGTLFIDNGTTLAFTEGTCFATAGFEGPTLLWGSGSLNVSGNARLEYPAGTNSAQSTFQQTGGFQIDGSNMACSVDASGSGNWTCGVALTALQLDTSISTGGFGGTAVSPGGASISNRATDF
jgi:hypothetical protein